MDISGLNIYFQNVRGLRTKTYACFQNIRANNYDVIVLVETWLCDSIFNNEICDDRYDVFRFDRDLIAVGKTTGGGVLIAVRRELNATINDDKTCSPTEMLWVTIPSNSFNSKHDLHLLAVYIPGGPCQLSDLERMALTVEKYTHNITKDHCIILGDFNLPWIKWGPDGPDMNNRCMTDLRILTQNLLNLFLSNGFTQHNLFSNQSGNILDLIFSNFSLELSKCDIPILKEDIYHPSLCIDATDITYTPLPTASIKKYIFTKGDYGKINEFLSSVDWEVEFDGKSIDEAVTSFYNNLNHSIDLHVPIARIKTSRRIFPSWYSSSLIKIIKEKDKMHKKWKAYQNPRDYDEFCLIRARYHRVHNACYNKFLCLNQIKITHDPKRFWTFVKSKRGQDTYPSKFTYNNVSLSQGENIVQGFNNYFRNMFSEKLSHYRPYDIIPPQNNFIDHVSTINFSEKLVLNVLRKLDTNKNAGCDNIPPLFISKCAYSLVQPLTILFNRSVQAGVFPDVWKQARIVPIHKKGSRIKIENYRPISILNTFGKLFEKLVYDSIYPIIIKGIPTQQHGFLRNRSTVTNLTLFSKYVLDSMECGGQVDVVYTDFEKAFDRVDHVILISKLGALGIQGDLLRWIESYLANRSQLVVMGGYSSDVVDIPSGVPQGSHLGPLLYNAYLYDIYACLSHSEFLMYADDTKIFRVIKSLSDAMKVQDDLNMLTEFYNKNRVKINSKKCSVISFTRRITPILYSYKISGHIIERVKNVKDLGIHLDSKFILDSHIEKINNKAYRNLGFIMRTCSVFRNMHCIKSLYFAYVRSVLEYGCNVWSPQYAVYKNSIERTQKKFINYLNYRTQSSYTTYEDSCIGHNMLSLNNRRILLDMMLLYDILHGLMDCSELVRAVGLCTPRRRTRHTQLLHVPVHRRNYASNETITRACRTYNQLFNDIDIFVCRSKPLFKQLIISKLKLLHSDDLH